MQSQYEQKTEKTMHVRKLSDPGEKDYLLTRYAGIFKNSIKEYSSRIIKKHSAKKNYSR